MFGCPSVPANFVKIPIRVVTQAFGLCVLYFCSPNTLLSLTIEKTIKKDCQSTSVVERIILNIIRRNIHCVHRIFADIGGLGALRLKY
jgi:hypothetical protein